MTAWSDAVRERVGPPALLRVGIILLFFLAEAFIGLVWRGIFPLPLPPTVLMLAPVAVCLVALFLLQFELGIAVAALSFLFPLTVFSYGSFRFGVMPFLIVLLFALYVLRSAMTERRVQLRVPGSSALLLLVAVSIASVAYAYVARDPNLAYGKDWTQGHWWIGYQAMGVFLFLYTWVVYIITANGLQSRTGLWAVYVSALAVCAYVVVLPLPGYLASFEGLTQLFAGGNRLVESASGTAAMLLALLTLALLVYVRRPVLRVALGFLFVLALLNLFLSYYLNTWLGFLAGAAIISLKRSQKAFLFFGLLLLVIVAVGYEGLLLIQQHRFSTPGMGDLRRLDIWSNALQVWLKRPVLGVGNANLPSYFLAYGTGRIPARVALLGQTHPHNTYLGILAENGLLGLGCVIWLIVAYVRTQWRAIDSVADNRLQGLAVGSLAVFVAGATTAAFASGLLPLYSAGGAGGGNLGGMAFVWILYGLGVATTRVGRCTSA